MRRLAKWQERHYEGDDFTGRGAFSEYPERWQGNGNGTGVGNGFENHHGGNGIGGRDAVQVREQAMRDEMLARNTNGHRGEYYTDSGRPSVADSQAPMMRQV